MFFAFCLECDISGGEPDDEPDESAEEPDDDGASSDCYLRNCPCHCHLYHILGGLALYGQWHFIACVSFLCRVFSKPHFLHGAAPNGF